MGVIQWVMDFWTSKTEQPEDEPDVPDRDPANLYRCTACETTYICQDMDSCPNCADNVESVPSERDLGMK